MYIPLVADGEWPNTLVYRNNENSTVIWVIEYYNSDYQILQNYYFYHSYPATASITIMQYSQFQCYGYLRQER